MIRRTLFALAAFAAAGCAGPPPRADFAPPPTILLVGVTGLAGDDLLLDDLPAGVRRGRDVLATGVGGPAALEWLDGRPAVDQLRAPRDPLAWARTAGLSVALQTLHPALGSGPEWVQVLGPPDPAPFDAGVWRGGLRVQFLRRADLDPERLAALLGQAGPDRMVVVSGLPAAPPPGGLDAAAIRAHLTVPVLAAGRGADALPLAGPRILGDVLSPLRGEPPRSPAARIAHWWTDDVGGMLVDEGGRLLTTASAGSEADAIDPALDPYLPRGDLLVLVRGSDEADLARMEILTAGPVSWTEWGLESIDVVRQPGAGYLALDLAVEPQGDGVLLQDWTGRMVEVRVIDVLEDAPLLGVPLRDAGDGRWLGLNGLRVQPWSRSFWKLTRPVEFDAVQWWTSRPAGVDLLWVPDGTAAPPGVALDD